jgi:uracil-DNA glycosylase family 4
MLEEFEKLKAEVSVCTRCALGYSRKNAVFGMGNPESKIFIIGEGPGQDEDDQGLPFVGRAGQLLDKILAACGFNRKEHVYIGNIVKCRPPQNRIPTPTERASCLPYLLKQIELIDPKIIILLGSTAVHGLIDPTAMITRERGKWRTWNNRLVMATYHPAALLRNPNLKRDTWEDFKQVVARYRELVNPAHYSAHC